MKVISLIFYTTILLPIWAARRLTGSSIFGRRFHSRPSAWDKPENPNPGLTPTSAMSSSKTVSSHST